MTDLDRFKLFYNDLGVTYDRTEDFQPHHAPKDCLPEVNRAMKGKQGYRLRVFGAAHIFNQAQEYVGSISNVTAQFAPRREKR